MRFPDIWPSVLFCTFLYLVSVLPVCLLAYLGFYQGNLDTGNEHPFTKPYQIILAAINGLILYHYSDMHWGWLTLLMAGILGLELFITALLMEYYFLR